MSEETSTQSPEREATVLDLYKSATKDWRSFRAFVRATWDARQREEWNRALAREAAAPRVMEQTLERSPAGTFPWRVAGAFLLAFTAQALIEPPLRLGVIATALYLVAIGLAVWADRGAEWRQAALPPLWQGADGLTVRLIPLIFSALCAVVAFQLFSGGLFTALNVALWLLSIGLLLYSFRAPAPHPGPAAERPPAVAKTFSLGGIEITFTDFDTLRNRMFAVLLIAAVGISLFFRLHLLDKVPSEPFSDHAEKIFDVYDISQGETKVFFERNTGREAFQMYWTLLVLNVFGTGFSFYSLKLGTVLLGIFTIPFVYLLGKEYGNRRVALFALFLFGVASWPNIISRIGLRFPLYPLFAAPALLYLTRGLRTRNRNDFLLAGLFLGIGLHGYSPFRIVPFLVVAAFLIYALHVKSGADRRQAFVWLTLVVVVSAFVFSPLLRYWIERPDHFGYRALTRLSSIESPLPGPAWQIFLSNMYNGLLMFNWDDGQIGAHSVTHRPALDVISAALFLLGVAFTLARYIRRRDWRDLLLLVSVPILILPSVLSLAFPGENPAMNRAGGASVTVFVIAALALDGLVSAFGSGLKRKIAAFSLVGVLFAGIAYSNYDLVFNKFSASFGAAHWNSSELGKAISDFENKYGQTDTAWIVPFPYWVDTRLPGIWAGVPNRDFALWPDHLADSLNVPAPKMFIYWNADMETERILKELYPQGKITRYTSASPGKDFFIFLVER